MSDEQDKLKLSLEPPKLFGRKKKSDAMGTTKRTSPAPAERRAPEPRPAEPEPTPATRSTDRTDQAEPAETAETAKTAKTAETAPTAPNRSTESAPSEQTAPIEAAPVEKTRPRAKLAPEIEPEPIATDLFDDDVLPDVDDVDDELPLLPLYPAAAVSGALAGAMMVVLIWLSLRGCEAVRGTSSCGGGPGFLLLVATFVLCIVVGSALLKAFQIPDPGSSSFLGVGLVAVASLLFLIEVLDHWSMLIVVPIIGVGAFLASVWVTKTFVEPGGTET